MAPTIDLVVFLIDFRQRKDNMKGPKLFIEQIKTSIFVAMHFGEEAFDI